MLPFAGVVAGPAYAPLVFGVAAAQVVYRALARRRLPQFDASSLILAALFAGLCFASAAWSVVPGHTLAGAAQVTAVFLGALIFLAQPALSEKTTTKVMRAMALAYLAGALILAFDASIGYPIQHFLSGDAPNAATKYNRGVAYAVLIAWPVLGRLWRDRDWRFALPLVLGMSLSAAIGWSLTAKIAALSAVAALLAASFAPRIVNWALAAGTAVFAAAVPFLLRAASDYRDWLFPYLKQSGQVRLELWNYMTARVFERPILGWGFWSAAFLPIRPRELASYTWVHTAGLYPHNQWLQLWVETGILGAVLAIVFVLLALKRARGLALPLQPFACAAFAAAVTVSLADFDLATDSWWAALAVCAYLFKTAAHADRSGVP